VNVRGTDRTAPPAAGPYVGHRALCGLAEVDTRPPLEEVASIAEGVGVDDPEYR